MFSFLLLIFLHSVTAFNTLTFLVLITINVGRTVFWISSLIIFLYVANEYHMPEFFTILNFQVYPWIIMMNLIAIHNYLCITERINRSRGIFIPDTSSLRYFWENFQHACKEKRNWIIVIISLLFFLGATKNITMSLAFFFPVASCALSIFILYEIIRKKA